MSASGEVPDFVLAGRRWIEQRLGDADLSSLAEDPMWKPLFEALGRAIASRVLRVSGEFSDEQREVFERRLQDQYRAALDRSSLVPADRARADQIAGLVRDQDWDALGKLLEED